MSQIASVRRRHPELESRYNPRGTYRMNVSTGSVTLASARTTTAGHLFAWRWAATTGEHCYIRKISARFTLTTAYTTAQETGCDLIVARSYTASHTGGTSVDTGSTLAGSGKLLSHMPTSLMGTAGLVRVATTGDLTAGTQTLDANPLSCTSAWCGAIGAQVVDVDGGGRLLYDARRDESPLVLAQDEGFVIRNLILMGAVGVGRWDFGVEWDEGVPA
jgi:hypothetical protein